MNPSLKYVPVLRVRVEELKVLKSFQFNETIYPCLEIVKTPQQSKAKGSKKTTVGKGKTFEEIYLPVIGWINSPKVFVDLPIHLPPSDKMKPDTLGFLSAITQMTTRVAYLKMLSPLSNKVIPVVSTYVNIDGKPGSIAAQIDLLRPHFSVIAVRTFFKTFSRDLPQIRSHLNSSDYLIMDWEGLELDNTDGDQMDIISELKALSCTKIIHRNPFPIGLSNARLDHAKVIPDIDNTLQSRFGEFGGTSFSDYAGIKKDAMTEGGTISPGFIYYDAVENEFYGYRYKNGGHKKGDAKPQLDEFRTRIVPDVIKSPSTQRMKDSGLDYLGSGNAGWKIIENIHQGKESGLSQPKYKRVSIEHYLHCIKTKINNSLIQ